MSRRKRRKIITLSIITILLGVYLANDLYKKWKNREKTTLEDINSPAFPIDVSNVKSITINDLKLIKLAAKWYIDGEEKIPADSDKVNFFLTYLNGIKKLKIFNHDPAEDYGFKNDTLKIDDTLYKIGTHGINPETMYILHPLKKVMLITADLRKHLNTTVTAWFQKEISIDATNIEKITFSGSLGKIFFFNLERSGSEWFYINIKGKRFPAANQTVESLLISLRNLRADMVLYTKMFLEKKDILSLTLKNSDESLTKLDFFLTKPEGFLEDACFFNQDNTKLNYQVNCNVYENLMNSRLRYIAQTNFEVARSELSYIELRSQRYLIKINKQTEDYWDFNGRNVKTTAEGILDFFKNLTIYNICNKNCKIRKNISNMLIVSFYNTGAERMRKFTFNFTHDKTWFEIENDDSFYFINQMNYNKLNAFIEALATEPQ